VLINRLNEGVLVGIGLRDWIINHSVLLQEIPTPSIIYI
jgi:hypothetical protein